jgi:hypothetical protein
MKEFMRMFFLVFSIGLLMTITERLREIREIIKDWRKDVDFYLSKISKGQK